ncbi:efflux RND transporter periplasmic adaptor subunit [Pseudomonas sp. RIT-PI-AD]|uniref:efflux RND transporter periplasmic adaptor subunit n=1 Tax=Pseudomonas sp. RIT-PI-AD TaxID=3035294 RepID=UPI0021D936D6|nr:efflux RND transporter periplasmic adaptor subunit [Pseudomonas sp. RIT-PI-AD]
MLARSVPLALSAIALSLLLDPSARAQDQAGAAAPPAEVLVETARAKDFPLVQEYPGRTAGYKEVEVRAQVSGILVERAYQEGSKVKKGQVLFHIDPRPYQAALDRAKGALAQEQARFRQTDRDLKRIRQLQDRGFASGSELDNAISNFEQSKANIEAAKAEVQARQIDLDYTTVKSPISGITSREVRSEGSLVAANDANSSLLTQVTQLDPLYVNFAYPDLEIERMRTDLQDGSLKMPADGKLVAEIKFANGADYGSVGHVDFTDSLITRGTGTVSARASVPNPEQTLLPGQFVRVVVKGLVYPNAIAVPEKAVSQGPQGTFVYIVDGDGKAQARPVKTGITAEHRWLIKEGLKDGDPVIIEGGTKLRPGSPVKVVQPDPSGAQPAKAAEGAAS